MYYTAMFLPHMIDGKQVYDVMFPDVPGCYSQGEGLEQALENAAEALHAHLGTEDPAAWPVPGTMEQAKEKASAQAIEDGEPLPPGTEFMLVKVPEAAYATKQEPVRLSISMRPATLKKVDEAAQDLGITRSGFIALAAQQYIKTLSG
jgi:predicted RNase H-like HicB family nuclease